MAKGVGEYQVKKCNRGYFAALFFKSAYGKSAYGKSAQGKSAQGKSANGLAKPDKGGT